MYNENDEIDRIDSDIDLFKAKDEVELNDETPMGNDDFSNNTQQINPQISIMDNDMLLNTQIDDDGEDLIGRLNSTAL